MAPLLLLFEADNEDTNQGFYFPNQAPLICGICSLSIEPTLLVITAAHMLQMWQIYEYQWLIWQNMWYHSIFWTPSELMKRIFPSGCLTCQPGFTLNAGHKRQIVLKEERKQKESFVFKISEMQRQTIWAQFPSDFYSPWEHNEILISPDMHRFEQALRSIRTSLTSCICKIDLSKGLVTLNTKLTCARSHVINVRSEKYDLTFLVSLPVWKVLHNET